MNTNEIRYMAKKIIQNSVYTIYGKMGRGKTFFSVMMASHYRRIYSNFDITLRGRSVTNIFTEKKQLQKIEYSDTKGIILLDEE